MDKENNIYKDSNIEIKENILKFSNHVIQLSNVSSVSISPMEKRKIPSELYIGAIAGLILLIYIPVLGIIIAGITIFVILKIISDNNALGYYLKISVNSGENYYFNASERRFLSDIVNVMENCFNSTNPHITIDMKNSNIQYGDGNVFQSK